MRLRNKTPDVQFISELSVNVDPAEVVDLADHEVVRELPDAVLARGPFGERLWPQSTWSLVSAAKKKSEE